MSPDQLAPHDRAAEEATLGSLLIDNDAIGDVAGFLKPEHFYVPRNRTVYTAIVALVKDGGSANQVSVARRIADTASLEDVGGAAYLGHLVYSTPSSVHAAHYAKIVSDLWLRRESMRVLERAYEAAPSVLDFEEFVAETTKSLYDLDVPQQPDYFTLRGAVDQYIATYGDVSEKLELRTGIAYLDKLLFGGFRARQLVVIGGAPGMGKSATGIQIAHIAAAEMHPVLYLSMEMGSDEVLERMVAAKTRQNVGRITDIYTSIATEHPMTEFRQVNDALAQISDLPMTVDSTAVLTSESLNMKIRTAKARAKVDLVVVDHIQLVAPTQSSGNRNMELDEITRMLKGLALDLDICIVALSQYNRAVAGKGSKPTMSSLRDSGTIEQNADIVILMHEPNSEDSDEQTAKLEFILAKNRRGRTGEAGAHYNKYFQLLKGTGSGDIWPDFRMIGQGVQAS